MKLLETIKIKVSGKIQGVGFRYATNELANKLHIKGTVENNPDTTVTIYATGKPKNLKVFLNKIKQSPTPLGIVKEVNTFQVAFKAFNNFKTIY